MKKGPIGIDMAAILVDHYFEADISNIKSFNFSQQMLNQNIQ